MCIPLRLATPANVMLQQVKHEELPSFAEVMAAGTAAALVPIKSITMNSKNDVIKYMDDAEQQPGPACTKLLSTLMGIQQGKIKDTFGWLDAVPEPKGYKSRGEEGVNGNGSVDNVNAL